MLMARSMIRALSAGGANRCSPVALQQSLICAPARMADMSKVVLLYAAILAFYLVPWCPFLVAAYFASGWVKLLLAAIFCIGRCCRPFCWRLSTGPTNAVRTNFQCFPPFFPPLPGRPGRFTILGSQTGPNLWLAEQGRKSGVSLTPATECRSWGHGPRRSTSKNTD